MNGVEILSAIDKITPEGDGQAMERICGRHAQGVIEAILLALHTAKRMEDVPVMAALIFNIGVYCAEHKMASTIPEIQERLR